MIDTPEKLNPTADTLSSVPAAVPADRRPLPWMPALLALALLTIYVPLLINAAKEWAGDEASQHGFLILPISAVLLWLLRDKIRAAPIKPAPIGLWILGLALLIETATYLIDFEWVPLRTLPLALAGGILALYGPYLWRIVWFPVVFLVLLAPAPVNITQPVSTSIQTASTTGTVQVLDLFGVPAQQDGFQISTPTVSVEVAKECSGFKKLTSLLAFAALYGFLYALPWYRHLALIAAVVPVALAVNILRIGGLVLIGSEGGLHALHMAHDSAEIFVVVVSFLLLTWIGGLLGCRNLRFSR